MQKVNLYLYENEKGTVITPVQRDPGDVSYCLRLIANEGYVLTDGETITPCVDTHTPEAWREIVDPEEKQ